MAVPHPERDDAAGHVGAGLVHQARHRRGQQADLDVLPAAGGVPVVQRGQDPDGGVQPGHHVEHRDARTERLAGRISGQAHQPGDGLDDEIVAGQRRAGRGAAEPADRGVDDRRVDGRHGLVVEAETGQAAGLEVLDEDVGAARELARRGQVTGILEIQRDRPLIAVDAEVIRRDPVPDRRLPGTGIVTARTLHLDNLGPQVRQQHGRVRPGQDPGEIRHQQPGQRPARRPAVPVGPGPLLVDGHRSRIPDRPSCGQLSIEGVRTSLGRRDLLSSIKMVREALDSLPSDVRQ